MKTRKWNSQFPLVKLRFHFSFSRMMKRALITGAKYMYRIVGFGVECEINEKIYIFYYYILYRIIFVLFRLESNAKLKLCNKVAY